jgi:osmoprotectant transport system ATP-binding protein
MLELRAACKRYGNRHALLPTDLTLPAGVTTVLIGPSGCGKSTLLKLLMGLIRPDSGAVYFEGRDMAAAGIEVRRRMGYVIQEGGLFPHLTARGNITLMARYLRWKGQSIDRRLQELVALTRFPPEALDRYPAQLSGGQRQRVSLMRALMLDPDLLLLDEPLGALDPMIRFELQNDLKTIFERLRKTVVLVTHDIGEAGFFGDRLVLLREGRIVQQGSLPDLVFSPTDPFVTRFINAQRSPLETLHAVEMGGA